MKENKLKESFILKAASYILLPVFVILIVASSIVLAYTAEYPETRENKNYYETNSFANIYRNEINGIYRRIKRTSGTLEINGSSNYYNAYMYVESEITDIDGTKINYVESSLMYDNIKYLVLDKDKGEAYTNVERTNKTDTIEEIKQEISSGVVFWNLEDSKIQTNIEKISQDNILQDSTYQEFMEENVAIYTCYNEGSTIIDLNDDISSSRFFYTIANGYHNIANVVLAICVIGAIITFVYLIVSSGHKKNIEGIALDWCDKLSLEIWGIMAFAIVGAEILLLAGSVSLMEYAFDTGIVLTIICTYATGITLIYLGLSIIKRIKTGTIIKNTITWKVLRFIKRICLKAVNTIKENVKLSRKITIAYVGFIAISFILIMFREVGIILLLGFWIYVYVWIVRKCNETTKIRKALKSIYEGNTDIELNEKELTGVLREMAIYVNDIAGGFSNAVKESIKSERLKTELITNVSHDIKTPLTSIINYVDLLKVEDIQNEKAKEYLEILDNKSQRLKKLIEDLVEASKASSGNIKLEKQLININELIKQVGGEFEDKFRDKGLELIVDYLKQDAYILADNRYIYRIIENLYSNVSKYALDDSRVYVDIKKNDNKINIAVKNISKERLNISTDELMQRFVRGDSSRNTEGSGLGLSIASSLTELQGGTFNIHLDGDLFKVVLEFESKEK